MVSRAGGDAGGYVHVKMHKAKTPEMLKWHHRWLVANTEAAELQFFKNDQELIPKEVIPIPHVGRVTAGAGSDKAWTLDILTKNKNSSYTGCSVKVPTQDGQDVWIRVIREMMDGSYKGPDLRHRLRSAVERWRHTLSDITGGDVRLHIDEGSFNTLPSEEFEHVNAFILGGQWFEGVDAFFREVRRSGQAAQTATGMHVADSVSRVHLRLDPLAPHGHARYDKISETLYIRLAWANNGAHRTLHSPNADALLSLVSTMWQLSLDKHIAQDPGWKAAHARLRDLVGTPVPITMEWAPELQEDCTMLREYVGTWATEEYLDSITEAAAGCFDRDPPYEELQTWVGGVSLLIEKTAVQGNKPPHVRIHRAPVRHDDDTGVELTKAMVTTFNKCRGVVTEHYSSLLCEAPMPDLKKEFSDALQHIYMAAMMRQAERITVGFDKMKLLFAINWDTFLATLNQLGVGPNPRLRLANQLLATSYPARVQMLTKAMDEQEWCRLCSIVNRVSVAFSCDATEHRSFLRGHELVDLCVVGKPEGQGGQSIVLSYSIKDLGSFCRGMLAVASQGETSPFLGNAMMHNPRLFDESSIDSERGLDEETERSEEHAAAAKNTFAQSFRSVANTENNDSTYVRAHTQYANDSTIVLYVPPPPPTTHARFVLFWVVEQLPHQPTHRDKDIPQEIQNILMKQNSEDDEAYPVSLSLLEETSTALNRAFAKEGRIESDSKQHVIVHAVCDRATTLPILPRPAFLLGDTILLVHRFKSFDASSPTTTRSGVAP